ncbi:6729_t:CDS:1, partial [Gigaspora rosea]
PNPTDPMIFVHHFSPALNEILFLHYGHDDKPHALRVFVKDNASNFLEAFNDGILRGFMWVGGSGANLASGRGGC